jgi:hypothetical protein
MCYGALAILTEAVTHHIEQNEVLYICNCFITFNIPNFFFVPGELVEVSMILNVSAHGLLDLKINTTNNP